ncbi:ABC-type multidrug transport system, permease component [Shewanella piezotolerans WP3]|uniref:ABC-type multidrug transport system, permease component n=1 Tax=Shewanella piezotolerans (strain WP3 / JCM 13877) TaxID=225849 RepID=B8CI71_SHEPW|nr:ABC transporter permease [Shewanella piezotolerans]ACJ27347.1 ABC-type multidrug transport system, permease component [Shewanella piezotolerans WP3]
MSFLQLILAELKAILADKTIVLTVFGGVLFYAILYPLPYLNQVPTEQQLVVVDHDNSSLSRQLIRHADASAKIQVVAKVGSIDEAKSWIETGMAHGLLVIPADFRRNLLLGRGVTLSYGGDASYFLIYSAVAEGLIAAGLDAGKNVQRSGLLAQGSGAQAADKSLNVIKLNSIPAFNPSLGYTPYIVPGLFLLILHQTLLIGTSILGASQWQQAGYWQQINPLKLICGRLVAFMLIYSLLTSFYVGYCYYWYDVSLQASFGQVALLLLPFLLATTAAGIAFSSLFTRRDLPTQVLLLISMPILFVSGFVWPTALIPESVVAISQIFPAVPGIMAMLELNQMGASWQSIMPQWLQLWGMTAIYFALAWFGVNQRLAVAEEVG